MEPITMLTTAIAGLNALSDVKGAFGKGGGGGGGGVSSAPKSGDMSQFSIEDIAGSEIPPSVYFEKLAEETGEDPRKIQQLLQSGIGQKMNGGPLYRGKGGDIAQNIFSQGIQDMMPSGGIGGILSLLIASNFLDNEDDEEEESIVPGAAKTGGPLYANRGQYLGGSNNPLGGVFSLVNPLANFLENSAIKKENEANKTMQTEYEAYVDSTTKNPILDEEFFESEGGSQGPPMNAEDYAASSGATAQPYERTMFENMAGGLKDSGIASALSGLGRINLDDKKSSGKLGKLMAMPTSGNFQGFKKVGYAADGKELSSQTFMNNYMPDGGDIRGPGGPKDDLIPVMASNGEYMLSKASVDRAGEGNHRKGIARLEEFNRRGNQRYG